MNYLIDTNVISEVRKGARCDPYVSAWLSSIKDEDVYLSVLVLGEIRRGIERRDGAILLEPVRLTHGYPRSSNRTATASCLLTK